MSEQRPLRKGDEKHEPVTLLEGKNSSSHRRVGFNNVGCLFSDSDDGGSGVPAKLVRENRSIDDAEVFDAKYAQVRIDDSCLGRGADARGRRLQKKN
jgi:hypothetical protein